MVQKRGTYTLVKFLLSKKEENEISNMQKGGPVNQYEFNEFERRTEGYTINQSMSRNLNWHCNLDSKTSLYFLN